MIGILTDMSVVLLLASMFVAAFGGFVKGVVGFALPMIVISGIGSFMPAEVAVAALIVPTVVTNVLQAFRTGLDNAVDSFKRFWRFNLVLFAMILLSAQLVTILPENVLFIILGGPIILFAMLPLAGWQPRVRAGFERVTEFFVALTAGFFGGLTGVWGPPTILYLNALDIPKAEHVRIQGVIYLLGSVLLFSAHVKSGVLTEETLPYSILLVPAALVGQAIGLRMQDRLDQALFKRLTLIVLVIAGLNLLRRGLMG